MDKPETPHEKQNNEITKEVEGNFNDESLTHISTEEVEGHIFTRVEGNSSDESVIRNFQQCACTFNSKSSDMERRKPILDNVMDVLIDPNIHIIGVYGSNYEMKDTLIERVRRRVDKDNLFDVVLTATLSKKPLVKKTQEEIGGHLGFHFNEKSEDKRANELVDRIKNEHKILIILCNLCNLCKGLDLGKVGIPFGVDHRGCNILLTSENEEVLSNQMHTQEIFML